MTAPITLKLDFPITNAKGETLSEITLARRPTVGDMLTAETVGGAKGGKAALAAVLTGVSWPDFKTLDATDGFRVIEAMEGMLGNSPAPAGEGSS